VLFVPHTGPVRVPHVYHLHMTYYLVHTQKQIDAIAHSLSLSLTHSQDVSAAVAALTEGGLWDEALRLVHDGSI
jgi:hypothetical protein